MTIFTASDSPLTVDLWLLPEVSLLSLAAVMEPMRGANRVAGRALFHWRLLSPDGEASESSSGLPLAVSGPVDPETEADAVISLASFEVQAYSDALSPALRRVARRGKALGGVEAGSWLLARAGLLAGKRATTHWEDLEAFADAHPEIDLRPDRYVVDGRLFTTGGASPALDMMLHLVRARYGYAIALDVASLFIYDQAHQGDDPQPQVSLGRLGWREPRLREAVALMEGRLDAPQPISEIAKMVGCSERRLAELFQNRLGTAPYAYYLTLRLNSGRRLAIDSALTMTEIADATGFGSASAFARAFRGRFGESPTEARAKADRGSA